MSLPAAQTTVLKDIAPFNPSGTHPPGVFPPGFFPPGSSPMNPSYPIRPTLEQTVTDEPSAAPASSSPQQVVDAALQYDQAYQKLFRGESFMFACPNTLPSHTGMCQDNYELISALGQEADEQEIKASLQAVAARYQAELENSHQNGSPRFRPTTALIRLLFLVAAENPDTATNFRLNKIAEMFRDTQVESIGDNTFEVDDHVTERERIAQKIVQYEALMEKHPDSISLCGNSIQKQFSILTEMDNQWQDEAAAPLVRAMAEMYRIVSFQSLKTRVTPLSTMIQVMKSIEDQQTDPMVKVRVALMAKMYRTTTESALDFARAFKQAPYDRQDLQLPTPALPAPALTTQPRHSVVPAALDLNGIDPQFGGLQTPGHILSPSLSTGTLTPTIYDSASSQYGKPLYPPSPQLSSMHNTMHGHPVGQLHPQQSMNTLHSATQPTEISKDDPVPPYPGEFVPPLDRQPKITFGSQGVIKSKDKMLNTNGDALYRFILDNLDFPTFRLHCYGSHTVTDVVATGKEVKTKERTIVDFSFVIDLALSMQCGPGELSILDDMTTAYRGKMYKELGKPNMPQSVHAWAKDYAASPKTGKEFRFRKAVYGLDRSKTLGAINQIINSTGHSTHRKVYFSLTNATIQVRADSALMTMIKDRLICCLLWLVCVWPIIWLIRRFGKNGGKWDNCRASYLCHRDPRDAPDNDDGVPLEEGDWVKIWERTIRLCVGNRIQSSSPIYRPTPNDSGVILFD